MSPAAPSTPGSSRVCAACGAPLTGRFCSGCGAPAGGAACSACGSELSPGARFCHRCGVATGGTGPRAALPGRERMAWTVAGVLGLLVLLAIIWRGNAKPTVPDMANAGNSGTPGAAPAVAGRAPDISNMSPRERFDRLSDRVVRAGESGDSITVIQFAPMALGAYSQLDAVDNDARYHAGVIDLLIGDFAGAEALADTILTQAPGHLFGYLIRGESAERQNKAAALTQAYRDFLSHYDSEIKAGRTEYSEHQPILDDFRTRAKASLGQ